MLRSFLGGILTTSIVLVYLVNQSYGIDMGGVLDSIGKELNKGADKPIKKKVKKFLSSYNQLENSIRIIETCCDEANDKGDPELKNYIAEQREIFRFDAETLNEDYSSYLTMGRKLTDPSTKSQEIKRITEIDKKAKKVNAGKCIGTASGITKTDHDVATYEEVQECKKEVKTELKQTYVEEKGGLTPDYYSEVQNAIAEECPVYKCIDDITVMTLELERALPAIKKNANRTPKKFNMSIAAFIKKKKGNELKEKRIAAAKERIALITNTLIYKEMVASFEKGFLTNPINVMMMMQLKVAGKSDSELAQLWGWGIKSFNACMFREVGDRFPEDQLKLMATEEGTNRLEVTSIAVKCTKAATKTFAEVLRDQQ